MNEEIKSIIMFSSLMISFLGLFLGVRNRFSDNRKKLLVTHDLEAKIDITNLSQSQFSHMDLNVHLLNVGKVPLFIKCPLVKLNKKVNGADTFQMIDFNNGGCFPLKVEPGQPFKFNFPLRNFVIEFEDKLSKNEKLRFIVYDTQGKVFKSKKVKFSNLATHLETEDLLLINKAN